MISTSANISGQKNINDPQDILDIFEYDELAYYDETLGKNKSPSQIIDLETKELLENEMIHEIEKISKTYRLQ